MNPEHDKKIRKGNFEIHYVCTCGYSQVPWRGNLFFVQTPVCPKCGLSKEKWARKVRRWVPKQKIVISGYWEENKLLEQK
ncbi:unnamed protein product [marine sediment metagenome]|uniref:Uncharacterized protein n=1 Tax=marine sediment metagenome TaxID=412755 RepID=X0XLV0_9ZZZZ